MMKSLFSLLAGVFLFGSSVQAANWPQFRGPDGQGHALTATAPLEFGPEKNLAWKTLISGRGWSSPVVWGDQVWVTTALEEGKSLRAVCLDLGSGKLLHDVEVFTPENPAELNKKNSYASPTPVIEEGRIYVHYGTMGTACLSTETGEVLWRNTDLQLDHMEGPGSSPILFGDLLIINCDGKDVQYVVALRKSSGEIAWKTERSAPFRERTDFRKAYSTPLIVSTEQGPQLISSGADQVMGYDPLTGEELWQVRYQGFSTVPRPVAANGTVFVCTGYMQPELWAIRVDGTGNVSESHVRWKFTRQVPANPSPLLVEDRIYLVSDKGVATCVDARTGDQIWQERLGGNHSASPTLVGDRIYFCSEQGTVTVTTSTGEFRILAVNELEQAIMASPAVTEQGLLIRTEDALWLFRE